MDLRFRNLQISDLGWLIEMANDPEGAKYMLSVFPITEHEGEEFLKKDLEDNETKHVVAELNGEAAGYVGVWWRNGGRDRHVAWVGIGVRKKHWAKGVGSGLMNEAIRLAKELGCRKLMLGVFEGNERAARLYTKVGFKKEAYQKDEVYIDGWKKGVLMGLELAPCRPRLARTKTTNRIWPTLTHDPLIHVRQLENRDLDEINRLQNCSESTKSSYRIPPVTKEQSKRWYEGLKSEEGKYCLACSKSEKLLGYLQFKASRLPCPCLKFEEIIVDVNHEPYEAADALVNALIAFKERYWYRRIFVTNLPETSLPVISALERQGFKKAGALKNYYFIDGHYVDAAVYGYP